MYLRLRLARALRSKTSPKSISQSLLFLVSCTCGALHSNDFSSLIQDPCFLLWLPPQGTKAFLTFFLGFVSDAFCLRVDIRAHLQVLGRTVRYVESCRLSYIRRVVSFLLENPRGGTAPKPTLLAVASVHVRLRVLATSRRDKSHRVNWCPDGHTFLCKFWHFQMAVSCLLLGLFTPNLGILGISVCSF